ncbi:hypothetical protein ACVIWV_006470 [Bradyrhizobium diazoefficiens]|jgi:hypothetical protein|uniref:Uncharacterized protein n=3 Tax=Bradyrhizobium TaxID=374 RepID=A0ABV4FUW7_9BRAD|nr:hypothetical protein [Bradyrhizobium japonicum]MCS3933138.1 hypothetical protein [Bradyrhizobium elkanii]BAR55691.1 hypothetical protein NK6_2510 [Bradyrhizobium diazoefficiens]MCP1737874.1 hypothetical protein [Bradyrhizobium japonicum]MCP1759664.1 hypothetical protein [Bradyrhizobium japonicum]
MYFNGIGSNQMTGQAHPARVSGVYQWLAWT